MSPKIVNLHRTCLRLSQCLTNTIALTLDIPANSANRDCADGAFGRIDLFSRHFSIAGCCCGASIRLQSDLKVRHWSSLRPALRSCALVRPQLPLAHPFVLCLFVVFSVCAARHEELVAGRADCAGRCGKRFSGGAGCCRHGSAAVRYGAHPIRRAESVQQQLADATRMLNCTQRLMGVLPRCVACVCSPFYVRE